MEFTSTLRMGSAVSRVIGGYRFMNVNEGGSVAIKPIFIWRRVSLMTFNLCAILDYARPDSSNSISDFTVDLKDCLLKD